MTFNIRMEVALDDPPLTRPTTWTRIDTTCGVRSLTTSRGVDMKTGDFETGTADAVVDNRTRDLDPTYASGTWYPDLTLRKRVRFSYDDGSNVTVLWTGYLDRLPNMWDLSASDGWVEVSAVDMLAILADRRLPPSVLHQTIVDLSPVAYWPLSETQGTFADDVAGTWDGQYRRPVTDSAEVMPYDSRPKARMGPPTTDDPSGQGVFVPGLGGSSAQTVSFWVYQDEESQQSGGATVWVQGTTQTPATGLASVAPRLWIGVSVSSGVTILVDDGSATDIGSVASNLYGLHHVVVTMDSSLGTYPITVYVDGVASPWYQSDPDNPVDPFADVDLATALAGLVHTHLGYAITRATPGPSAPAVVADVAYWDSVLTAQQIADLYAAGTTAWDGDTTGERLGRVLDALGVDNDDRDIATGKQSCGPTRLGMNALEYLRRLVATEGGALYVSADGKITFDEDYSNDPTPLDVIGDSGCPYSAITLDYSLDRMINTAHVTRENGVTQTHANTTAVTAFGPRTADVDTLHRSPSGAKSRAAELVVRNKDLRAQILDVTLPGLHPDVPTAVSLDTEIGDPYTVQYQPPTGAAGTALVRVDRITHDFTPGEWSVSFGVDQQTVLPTFKLDTAGRGTDQSVLAS